ncbi:MAG TPA: T9SS type A sorting domain-containing protein [Puia sp.]|nr:T9SS type A sorting domain-containing protein [Puia sp.]
MKHFVPLQAFVCLVITLLLCGPRANAQCSGQTNTTTTGANAGAGGTAWQNPNNVGTSNGNYATVDAVVSALGIITTTTDYLTVTNLGLAIPSTNTICGVVVTINRRNFSLLSLGSSAVTDNSILLVKGGTRVGTDHAAGAVSWPGSSAAASYGGVSDLWGTTLTPADVNAGNFGVAISAKLVAEILSVAFSAQIDQVTVTVYSSAPIVLPIVLEDFTAHSSTGGNVLTWTVSASASAAEGEGRWVVERSSDGSNWSDQDVLTASPGRKDYSYLDTSPLAGTSFYRLGLLNVNGSVVYSAVKTITGGAFASIHCYPNPFTDMIHIVSPHPFSKLSLKNLQGQTLWVKEYGDGVSTAQVPAAGLPAGLYFVQVDGAIYKIVKN